MNPTRPGGSVAGVLANDVLEPLIEPDAHSFLHVFWRENPEKGLPPGNKANIGDTYNQQQSTKPHPNQPALLKDSNPIEGVLQTVWTSSFTAGFTQPILPLGVSSPLRPFQSDPGHEQIHAASTPTVEKRALHVESFQRPLCKVFYRPSTREKGRIFLGCTG
jgi:hypothetical protein